MRLKYYLRGAGIGMIITALILTLSGGETTISDREVIERAKKLGMVEAESGSTIKDQISVPSSQEALPSSSEASSVAQSQEQSSVVQSQEQSSATQSQQASSSTSYTTVKKTVTIYLEKGVTTQKVSEQLERLGIIDNASFFNTFLNNNGYADKLYEGECTFVKGMSRDEIVRILTTGK